MSEKIESKKWYKSLSALSSVVVTVAVIAWNWNVIKTHIFNDDSALIETTTSELLEESLGKNDDLKKFARVCEIKETRLVKEGSGNSYTGYAKVVMQVRTKDSTDEQIKYGGNPITVSYSLKVLYDGRNVMLNDAEMEDADLAKLLKAAGVSDDDEEADESDNDNSVTSADESPANDGEPPLDGVEFVKKRKSLTTELQRKRLVDGVIGRIIEFRDCEVDDITDKSFLIKDDEKALLVTLYVPTCDYYVQAKVTDPRMVASGENLEKGIKLKVLSGKLRKDKSEVFHFYVDNARFVKEKPEKTNTIKSDKSVAEKLFAIMDESNKLTLDAVGWAREPIPENQKKTFAEKIAAMSEQEQTALLEQFKTEHENLKQFIEIVSIVDSYRKQMDASPLMNKDIVREFLTLTPESQKEHLEKLRAKVEEIKRKAGKTEMSATKEMTGADIVRECEKKPNGFSYAQIESLQKKLAGRRLTFEDGEVVSVSTDINMDGRVCILAGFGKRRAFFVVRAYFPKSETDHLVQTIDKGTHVKFLGGRVISSEDKPQPLSLPFLTLTDAKIVVSKE